MSEEVILNGHKEETPEPQGLTMIIKQSPDGQVSVEAPGNGKFFNVPICLFLLDMARDHVKMSNARAMAQEKPVITKAGRYKGLWPK